MRLIYSRITQRKAQGPFRTCNGGKEKEDDGFRQLRAIKRLGRNDRYLDRKIDTDRYIELDR